MKTGKLPNRLLKELIIDRLGHIRQDILLRPAIGEDCCAVDFGENVCVLSTDPVTGAKCDTGTLSVHVSCNDIASCGINPVGIMVVILAPVYATEKDLGEMMEGITKAANSLNVEVIGGHTEITDAVNRFVITTTAIGKAKKGSLITSSATRPGDFLVMTKWAGLEGTSIIAKDMTELLNKKPYTDLHTDNSLDMENSSDMENSLISKELPGSLNKKGCDNCFKDEVSVVYSKLDISILDRAKAFDRYLSVVEEGVLCSDIEGVNAMHDATEGGILGAAWEMAESSGNGLVVYCHDIPVMAETEILCKYLGIDPLKLISSGSMLIACKNAENLISRLDESGIKATVIGRFNGSGKKVVVCNGIESELQQPDSDELYRGLEILQGKENQIY